MKRMLKDYVKAQNLTFLNVLDIGTKIAAQYRLRGVPTTFFINPGGKVVAFAPGYREWDSKVGRKMLDQLISER